MCYIPEIAFWVSKIGSRTGMGPLKDEASVTTARLGYRTGMNMSFLCQNPPKVLKALDSSL